MASNTNSIKVAVVVLILFTLFAIIMGMIIPFNVDQSASVQTLSGDADILTESDAPTPLLPDTQVKLDPGQTVRLQPGSEASVTFTINKGRAHLTGPTSLTLVESFRRATSLGHALDDLSREYVLTLAQTQGTVQYIFANTSPSLADIQMTIQLPDGNYIPQPSAPCWTITVDADGQSTIDTVPCPQAPQTAP